MKWVIAALTACAACGQAGVVEGVVTDAVSKTPVQGATVKLNRGDKEAHSTGSDAQGRFRIEGVADGEYRAVVWHDDYVELAGDHPAARRFVVSAANAEVRLRPELLPLAQIAGRVLSAAGEPMQGVPVGMRKLWHGAWTQTTISEAGGVFRFRRLEPGAWFLAALPTFQMSFADVKKNPKPMAPPPDEEGQRVGWVWTYFPGSPDLAGAERIVLRPGAALEGYDIRLKTLPVRRLSGVVVDSDGKPAPKAGVFLADASNSGVGGGLTAADAAGRFVFDAVIDGDWRLDAMLARSGQSLRGFTSARVSRRDVAGVEVRVQEPFAVKGVVVRDEPRDRDGKRKVTAVHLEPVDAPDFQDSTFHEQDGSFVLKDVYAGRYRVTPAGHVPGFYMASIWYGDQEVTTQAFDINNPPLPLKIVYSSGAGSASGKVEGGTVAWAVLVPQDEALRDAYQFIRRAKCDADGRFTIDSLRPGSYYAFAFDRVEEQVLSDVEFVRRLVPRAARLDVKHGESARIDLRVQAWPDY